MQLTSYLDLVGLGGILLLNESLAYSTYAGELLFEKSAEFAGGTSLQRSITRAVLLVVLLQQTPRLESRCEALSSVLAHV